MNNWILLLQGPGGLTYIVFSNESGPSDQTDIDSTVLLDPLGRWSMIRETHADWPAEEGGRPGGCWVFLTSLLKVD